MTDPDPTPVTGTQRQLPLDDPDLAAVWRRAVAGVADGALSAQQRAWLRLTRPLGLVQDTALLAAPNEFTKDLLDSRLRPFLSTALSAAYGREIRVAVTVEHLPDPEPMTGPLAIPTPAENPPTPPVATVKEPSPGLPPVPKGGK